MDSYLNFSLPVIYTGNTGGSTIIPDSRITIPAENWSCRICKKLFKEKKERDSHLDHNHPIDEPELIIIGMQSERGTQNEWKIHNFLREEDIKLMNTDVVHLNGNPNPIDEAQFKKIATEMERGEVRFSLHRRETKTECVLKYAIPKCSELNEVEKLFYKYFNKQYNLLDSWGRFNRDVKDLQTAKDYSDGLSCYVHAVALKDQHIEWNGSLSEYKSKMGQARDCLSLIDRPLGKLIMSIMDIMDNDVFTIKERDNNPYSLGVKRFFSGIDSAARTVDESKLGPTKIIPLDEATKVIMEFCAHRRQDSLNRILDNSRDDCWRDEDCQKGYAILWWSNREKRPKEAEIHRAKCSSVFNKFFQANENT